MKKHLFLLAALMIAFCACENKNKTNWDDDDDKPSKPKTELKAYAYNLSGVTDKADILLMAGDTSLLLCDINRDNKYCIIYLDPNFREDIDHSVAMYIDKNGVPAFFHPKKWWYMFGNVKTATCDLASWDGYSTPEYYFGVQVYPDKEDKPWDAEMTAPFTKWWNEIEGNVWSWDDQACKDILPYLLTTADYCLSAIRALTGQEYPEWNCSIAEIAEKIGKTTFYYEDTIPQSVLSDPIVRGTGSLQESVTAWNSRIQTTITGEIPTFEGSDDGNLAKPENRIVLKPHYMLIGPEENTYTVTVEAAGEWSIPYYYSSWCTATKEDASTLKIAVSKNTDTGAYRFEKIPVRTENGSVPTYMSVNQKPAEEEEPQGKLTWNNTKWHLEGQFVIVYNGEIYDVDETPLTLELQTVFDEYKAETNGAIITEDVNTRIVAWVDENGVLNTTFYYLKLTRIGEKTATGEIYYPSGSFTYTGAYVATLVE